jgi:hypothetical protein
MRAAAKGRARRLVQHALAAAGLLLCMATSYEGPFGLWSRGPHLHNASRTTTTVLLRRLRDTVQLDCAAVGADPGARIPDAAFGLAVAHQLSPGENLPLAADGARECVAVRVSGGGLPPAIVFWSATDLDRFERQVPPSYDSREEWRDGAVVMLFEDGRFAGYRSQGGDFVFEIEREAQEISPACAIASEAARPAVSLGFPIGHQRLLAVDEGPDGCIALRMAATAAPRPARDGRPAGANVDAGALEEEDGGVAEPEPEPEPDPDPAPVALAGPAHYVCVPRGMFPFRAGEVVHVETGGARAASFSMSRGEGGGLSRLALAIAPIDSMTDYAAQLGVQARERGRCPFVLNETCAETSVAVEVEFTAAGSTEVESFVLRAGEGPYRFDLGATELEVALPISRSRALLETDCAAGPATPGVDAVAVVVKRWREP